MECFVQNAVDYKGMPADRTETGGLLSATLIAVIELCERFSTIGITVNLVPYLMGTLHLSSPTAANIVSNFIGTSFILCPLGGILADSFLGRFRTVLIFALIQGLGTSLLSISAAMPELIPPPCDPTSPSSSCVQENTPQMAAIYIPLYVMALGSSGLIPNVSAFFKDQFDDKDDNKKSDLTLFFNFFFFFFILGCLLAVTIVVYIQNELSRSWGYGICSLSMAIAILMFLSGIRTYRYKKLTKSPLVPILQVLVAAFKKRKYQIPQNIEQLYEDNPQSSRINHTDQLKFLDKAAIPTREAFISNGNSTVPDPWKVSSVTKVEEVKIMVKLLPVWITAIPFWAVFAQLITFSVEQASTMNRSFGKKLSIPAASLTIFSLLPILFAFAIYNPILKPIWRRFTGKPGFTDIQKIGIGLFLAILGIAAAALSEVKRLSVVRTSSSSSSSTLPISVFLLVPQFALIGSGVGFMYSGELGLFVTQSRKEMKTAGTGIFLTSLGFGFLYSSMLVSLVKKLSSTKDGKSNWIGESINVGRLDCFYGLLVIIISLDFVVFLVWALWFKPHERDEDEMKPNKQAKASTIV